MNKQNKRSKRLSKEAILDAIKKSMADQRALLAKAGR
jgi:hypothetical protein